ncbi:hypothetical protein BO99DRAFT_470097 [Aspergillus violaceofuscus CBS 115571]|uniref:Uncharacterized protein n=1 Tax=Aspergillus violaceofuscus (strain CBS 115571) TaxID=1450538 RepID=A0A2V5HJB1_ASPV1|nr:hypothetical protein BO99DRAFT_470097 [Aspergillus violaceofuscus CBS 115571]
MGRFGMLINQPLSFLLSKTASRRIAGRPVASVMVIVILRVECAGRNQSCSPTMRNISVEKSFNPTQQEVSQAAQPATLLTTKRIELKATHAMKVNWKGRRAEIVIVSPDGQLVPAKTCRKHEASMLFLGDGIVSNGNYSPRPNPLQEKEEADTTQLPPKAMLHVTGRLKQPNLGCEGEENSPSTFNNPPNETMSVVWVGSKSLARAEKRGQRPGVAISEMPLAPNFPRPNVSPTWAESSPIRASLGHAPPAANFGAGGP